MPRTEARRLRHCKGREQAAGHYRKNDSLHVDFPLAKQPCRSPGFLSLVQAETGGRNGHEWDNFFVPGKTGLV